MKRADELITDLRLASSRSKARALIEEGKVYCGGKPVDKPSRKYREDAEFVIDSDSMALRFVSRAGLKLEAYLDKFGIDLRGARIFPETTETLARPFFYNGLFNHSGRIYSGTLFPE